MSRIKQRIRLQKPPTSEWGGWFIFSYVNDSANEQVFGKDDDYNSLCAAELYAKDNPDYQRNVSALTSVLPPKLEAGDISARIGVSWVDVEDYQALTALSLMKRTITRTVLWFQK